MKKFSLLLLLSFLVVSGCQKLDNTVVEDVDIYGIDVWSDCESYFDWCNNCSVVDWKVIACTEMYCETPSEPKCIKYKWDEILNSGIDNEEVVNNDDEYRKINESEGNKDGFVNMTNPASTYCVENWWKVKIVTDSDWGQYGMCNFPDGSVCEEWMYFDGICEPGNKDEPLACTMDYTPVCAKVYIQCITTPCDPIEQTFWNRCAMEANKLAKFLYEGECKTEVKPTSKSNCSCPEWYRQEGEVCNPECYYSNPQCLSPSVRCE